MRLLFSTILTAAAVMAASVSLARAGEQDPVDRSDPSVIGEELELPGDIKAPPRRTPLIDPSTDSEVASIDPFVAGAIRIEGAVVLPPSAFAAVIEPYLGRLLDRADLRALAGDVAAAARRAGLGLATAWIPPQSVADGILRVHLEEGRIDTVEAVGEGRVSVERRLASLVGERPVRTAELERQLLLAGDAAGVFVGKAQLLRRNGRNVLRVETGLDRISGRFSIDNWGSDTIGPVKVRLVADVAGVLMGEDRLTVGGIVTPLQPSELQFVQAGYAFPIGTDGTEVALRSYLSHSRPGGPLQGLDYEGTSVEFEAGISHPVLRSRAASLWTSLDLGFRDSRLDREGLAVRDDRVVTATASAFAIGQLAGGQGRFRLSLVQGLPLLGATRSGDPLASRTGADADFSKLAFWGRYLRPLGAGFSLELSSEGQLASGPLLSSEELGLGGRYFLRGYDYRELAGDDGVAGAAELRFDLADLPRPFRNAQIYGFADAGRVTNKSGGSGGGTLASAGGGVRLTLDQRVLVGVEFGVPLEDGAFGRRPSPRLSFTINGRF